MRIDAENGFIYGRLGRRIGFYQKGGYLWVRPNGRGPMRAAHCVIWESVNGPIPEGMEIDHLNRVRNDNRISNLECVTPMENSLRAWAARPVRERLPASVHFNSGERNGRAVLTAFGVRVIRRLRGHLPNRAVALVFGVSPSSIAEIHTGQRWA